MEDRDDIEVLICGAGAAGLTLAIDLARRGVSFHLVDKLVEPFGGSRGKGIQPRTQEVFEDLGVIDRMAAAGSVYPPFRSHRADGSSVETQGIAIAPATAAEPYLSALMIPQFRTEAILRERLAELGHAPRYGRELRAFEQDADTVAANIAGPGGIETVRCRYLVGSDGGRSFVRQHLGIGFSGKTLGVRAMVADVLLDGLPRDAWHRFNEGDTARQFSFCPLPGGDLFQLQAPTPVEGEADLSVAGIQAFIDARLPGNALTIRDVAWASAYSMNARLADRYRVGRVFLMGDAAHIHPPTGGQGLNTSVQDAYNLGWKLGAVLAGAAEALLDSYEEERRPIAAGMLGLSTDLLEKAKQGDMRRGREVHQLDLGYADSSLSLGLGGAGVAAGDRMPDAPLLGAGGQPRRLFDLLQGPHWTLIARGIDAASLPMPRPGLRTHRIGTGGEFRDMGGHLDLAEGGLLLIRPDGYVGISATMADGDQVVQYLATIGLGTA
jgi:2-polyprenyl-6-methoxyphenol hydroxylase-like FAD-dependent oxidoreductase